MARIDYWHTMLPCMGSRKLSAKLRSEGIDAGRKLVRTLMREMGLCAVYPRPNLSKRNFKEGMVPYLLRNKAVLFPNQVWSIDITYIKMRRGHMYLTAIIDWFSRRIVGWELSDTLDARLVLKTVREAVERCGIPAILNSDQGNQFTSEEYKELLHQLHIRQSMDGKSRWADNIMIEHWFHSPKQLRQAIRTYVEDYNAIRPHEALDYTTPNQAFYASFASPSANLDRTPPDCCA